MEAHGPRILESWVYTRTGLIDAALKLIYHAPWMIALAAALAVARDLWRQRTLDSERRALVVLLATGAVGRYFYAWVPRAANGHELALADVKARLGRIAKVTSATPVRIPAVSRWLPL